MSQIKINGVEHTIDADPQMPLLWAIRDIVGLTGTKFGCGVGACGACTIHMDGQAVRSCLTTLADAQGHEIVTIEGLSADGSHPVQLAWEANNVPQCGYCQAGQIMQAAALIKQTPKPSDQQIVDAMSGNICRCGTYLRIRQAIKSATESVGSLSSPILAGEMCSKAPPPPRGSFSAFMSGFASSPLPRRLKCRRFSPMPFFPLTARAL